MTTTSNNNNDDVTPPTNNGATTGSATAAAAAPPTKRKRNRKKKKKTSAATVAVETTSTASSQSDDDEEVRPQSPAPNAKNSNNNTSSSLNPHVRLRTQLLQLYDAATIDAAMEQMWNENLPYDEYDHVLHYLKTGKPKQEAVAQTEEKKPAVVSTTPSRRPPEAATPAPAVVTEAPQRSASMVEKLDFVANYENMMDAIFGLTEWVQKVAKPAELQELCATTTTLALVTVYRRSILFLEGTKNDSSVLDTDVIPAMTRLMTALLTRCGVAPKQLDATALEALLRQANGVVDGEDKNAVLFNDRVSRFIVSRISLAVEEALRSSSSSSSSSQSNGSIPSNTDSTSVLGGTLLDEDAAADIAHLFSKREAAKTAAKRSAVQALSLCQSLAPVDQEVSAEKEDVVSSSSIDKNDILMAIVGEDDAEDKFARQRAELDELKKQLEGGESDRLGDLRKSLESLTTERDNLSTKISELQATLNKLQAQQVQLNGKVVRAQEELQKELQSNSSETTALHEQVQEATQAVQYATSVKKLVDVLQAYDVSLDRAVRAVLDDASSSIAGAFSTMDAFVTRVNVYLETEAQCVEVLKKRIDDSKKQAAEMKSEIADMEGLGLTTTLCEIEKSRVAKEKLAVKDAALIEKLNGEAKAMFEGLLGRLKQYKSAETSHNLTPLSSKCLQSIPKHASRLGIDRAEDLLKEFAAVVGESSRSATHDSPAPATKGLAVATQVVPKNGTAVPSPKLPKLATWATAGSKSSSNDTKTTSLLDIQQEELESKDTVS